MCVEAGGVGRLEVCGGWRCGEAGGVWRLEVWGGWRCGEVGGVGRLDGEAGGVLVGNTIIVTMEHRIYGNVNHALTSRARLYAAGN